MTEHLATPAPRGHARKQSWPTSFVGRFGAGLIAMVRGFLAFIGGLVLTLLMGLRPGTWRRTLRAEFQLYCFEVGIRALPATLVMAVLIGIGLVVQSLYWLELIGQPNLVGEILDVLLVRQIAPTLTALIIIGRSGSVMMDEIGHMRAEGQIRMLSAHGIDPRQFILIPRAFAVAISLFTLTILFLPVAFGSGFLAASALGTTHLSPLDFAAEVLSSLDGRDYALIPVKTLISGYVIGYISCFMGIQATPTSLGVREQLPKTFVISLIATSVIGGLTSVLL